MPALEHVFISTISTPFTAIDNRRMYCAGNSEYRYSFHTLPITAAPSRAHRNRVHRAKPRPTTCEARLMCFWLLRGMSHPVTPQIVHWRLAAAEFEKGSSVPDKCHFPGSLGVRWYAPNPSRLFSSPLVVRLSEGICRVLRLQACARCSLLGSGMACLSAVVLVFVSLANAAPSLLTRQAITPLSSSQIDVFTPYTFYASAGYCSPASTLAWNCGANCDANPGFHPVASGGDGDAIQFWFVGVDESLGTVIVSHQGTNFEEIEAVATDADFFLETLNTTLFPGLSSAIEAHSGFANEQAKTATLVLAAVKSAISKFGVKKVTVVGHSLGGAIGLLDSVYLPLHISGVTVRGIFYGMPRVGNQAFADHASIGNTVTHINNREDIVPILPGMFLGYHHPTGEIHIGDSGVWDSCPGQDNPSTDCSTGDVPTILQGNVNDHDGPYNGVEMGC